jgi:hypothetical protein
MKTTKTKHEKEHMNKIADLGCIICRKMGFPNSPAELHHIKDKTGMGRKASNFEVIPLCPRHHRQGKDSYHYSPKEFTEKWGTQKELLTEVLTYVNYCTEVLTYVVLGVYDLIMLVYGNTPDNYL